jgi:signal peptidase II
MSARLLGFGVALAALIADQASKYWLIHGLKMQPYEHLAIAPFLDFEFVSNPGISFSLLQQGTATGRWALFGLTLVATILLAAWLWRAKSKLAGAGLGAIVGGALGNGYDRLVRDAVVDFVDLHAAGYHFYIFNLADSAITLGVVLLLYDGLVADRRQRAPTGQSGRSRAG